MNGGKTLKVTVSRMRQLDDCLCDGCRDSVRLLLEMWERMDAEEKERARNYLLARQVEQAELNERKVD